MKNNINTILLIIVVIILLGNLNFRKNVAFEYYDTFKLFPENPADSIFWEVVTDSNTTLNQWPYKRVKFMNSETDTLLSVPIENRSGYALLSIRAEPIDSIYVNVYVGQFVGRSVGDSLGMKWYKITTQTTKFSGTWNLADSTWFSSMAHPYSMIKIEETKPVKTKFVIDWVTYKN
ncbi:MAG: hypothetical protein GXO75_08200, partial [Calditrichaeota bacterium]|nr:hypothetical protein [Calditrichota bacterium]